MELLHNQQIKSQVHNRERKSSNFSRLKLCLCKTKQYRTPSVKIVNTLKGITTKNKGIDRNVKDTTTVSNQQKKETKSTMKSFLFVAQRQRNEHTHKNKRNDIKFISLSSLHKGSLIKGFTQKNHKNWAEIVRQTVCITPALGSYSFRISCFSVSRVVA